MILYSTGCPRCKVLEKKLKDKNIDFEIKTDFNEEDFINLGFTTVPILFVDEGVFLEFKDAVDYINRK